MASGKIFSKFVLTLIFLSFWIASACLIIVGAVVWHNAGSIDSIAKSTNALVPTVIMIGSGIFLFLLGVIGCFACLNENRCLLLTFFILLAVILLGEISSAAIGLSHHAELRESIDTELNRELNHYHNDSLLKSEINLIQSTYHCCGVNNYTDWFSTPWSQQNNQSVPDSCCTNRTCQYSAADDEIMNVYGIGCLVKLETDFSHYLGLIVAFALVIAILQLLGLTGACILFLRKRRSQPPYQPFPSPTNVDDTQHV